MARRTLAWLLALGLSGCMEGQKPDPLPRTPSLYTRLGGEAGITRAVDGFLARVAAERAGKGPGRPAPEAGVKRQLVRLIGAATGGPQRPTDQDREAARALRGADFDALAGALAGALDEGKAGAKEQEELKAALEPLRKDVLGRVDGEGG